MDEDRIFASVCPTHGAIQFWIGDGTLAGNEPTKCFLYVKEEDLPHRKCNEDLKLTKADKDGLTGGDLE